MREAATFTAPPAEHQATLTGGTKQGLLDAEFVRCEHTRGYLETVVATAPPAQKRAALIDLAEAVRACGCVISIPRVKALL